MTKTIEQLQATVAELEEENARLIREVVNRNQRALDGDKAVKSADSLYEQLATAEQRVSEACDHTAWISVTDALPKPVKGVSYNKWMSDVVLVIHSDRPDYPVTAHAILGDELGAGISILTNGASDHKEIAWYSAGVDLQNPFNLKDKDYSRYLPRIFGAKITHWMPLPKAPANGASS